MIDRSLISRKSFGDSIDVPAQGSVVWTARLTPETTWAIGMYDLRISPAFGGDSPINPLGTIVRFEVRPVQGLAEQAELIRRRLMRAYATGLAERIAQEADRLLRVYPQSSIAYEMKAELAKQEGRGTEAATLLRQALALITSGQDTLFLRQRTEPEVR